MGHKNYVLHRYFRYKFSYWSRVHLQMRMRGVHTPFVNYKEEDQHLESQTYSPRKNVKQRFCLALYRSAFDKLLTS